MESEGRHYDCDFLPFMEIGSVAHKYYLINIRLPVNDRKGINVGIGEIKDIRLVVSVPSLLCQPASVPRLLQLLPQLLCLQGTVLLPGNAMPFSGALSRPAELASSQGSKLPVSSASHHTVLLKDRS